jgi:hypothetical protein
VQLCVLCVSVVRVCPQLINHRDTEDTELHREDIEEFVAQNLVRLQGFDEVLVLRALVTNDARLLPALVEV